ncbi:hypothetical protein N7516_000965 [Penicillium verrucosum]|uniref:uncharacterized protein n=1 Tax=Penicillium verrucosum TaxID=60171 RepID=UPI0025456E0A|nr:uncharacterized protein N7516_000965 [Penicillium verrucosum]KAJ5940797.1 hypothetical protein N7516_000965 [Penicillium verrucosum]
MSTPVLRVGSALKPLAGNIRATTAITRTTKEQPWKAFWPLAPEKYTEKERAEMPWLTFKYDKKNKPEDRAWRAWCMQNQSTVARRGAW